MKVSWFSLQKVNLTAWPSAKLVAPIAVALITAYIFLPSLNNDFVNWDDPDNLINNSFFRGFGIDNLRWMFTAPFMGHYIPITWLSFALNYVIGDMEPFGYHLTNLLLHTTNSLLLYFLLVEFQKAQTPQEARQDSLHFYLGAAVGALFFAIHPLRVEPVVWATGRRYVLSGFFILLSLFAYLKAQSPSATQASVGDGILRRSWLILCIGCYALAVLSHEICLAFIVIFFVLDQYIFKQGPLPFSWKISNWKGKIPLLTLAGIAAITAVFSVSAARQSHAPVGQYDLAQRLLLAFFAPAFYLAKMIIPINLTVLYPSSGEPFFEINPLESKYILSCASVLILSGILIWQRRRFAGFFTAWISYLALLLPSLFIHTADISMVNDRYSYHASLPLAALLTAGMARIGRPGVPSAARIVYPAVAAFLILWTVLSRAQVPVWSDSQSLWTQLVKVNPGSYSGHYMLGEVLDHLDMTDQAITHYLQALRLYPIHRREIQSIVNQLNPRSDFVNLAGAYAVGQMNLPSDPEVATLFNNLGNALRKRGDNKRAVAAYSWSLRIKPLNYYAHLNLANLLESIGHYQLAVEGYKAAVYIRPNDATARYLLGNILLKMQNSTGAIER